MAPQTRDAKTVMITGCSSGIGLATARYFQQQGWNVIATFRNPEKRNDLHILPRVLCLRLDVTDHDSIHAAVAQGIAHFGAIDVMINNAGYALMGAFETLDVEQIQRQFATNVHGLMEGCRAILPHFRARGAGHIVNIASMVGRIPLPLYSVYNASKHAVEGFTEGLTYELEPLNIRVKLVEPGAVNTDFFGRSSDRENRTGVTAYEDYSVEQLAVMDRTGPGGSRSEDAARVIFRAANDQGRRLRFQVGLDAKMLFLSRALMPNSLFRWVIRLSLTKAAMNSVGRLLYREAR
ncbi:SDR family oxidoreductase [Alcanivorax sp. JB21]|uniref:SDR family oxidoreductase n=1 Tax=Alcanivorax limicola TaxID=2874102 RepID=UPI001CBAA520|nr:SDR family oxidoreductase [Alcanivorax limicola]MBZ2188599.1 SDR family oxidoreductase [Alcanivorax limicola]